MDIILWDLKRLETNQAVDGNSARKQAHVIIAEAKAIFRVFSQLRLDVRKPFFPRQETEAVVFICVFLKATGVLRKTVISYLRTLRVCLPVP